MQPTVTLFSPAQIATLLYHDAAQVLLPTPEQSAVIAAELGTQYLVVAGAGSGKTETISQRVVWLIANNLVQPQEILGLTFTNKAAGELAERIMGRLQKFVTAAQQATAELSPAQNERVQALQQQLAAGHAIPQISTYNAFASAIVREFGVLAGLNPATQVLDEATAFLLAEEIILQQPSATLQQLQMQPAAAAQTLIELENAIVDNAANSVEINAVISRVIKLTELPRGSSRATTAVSTEVQKAAAKMQVTKTLLPLVTAYQNLKAARGVQEFSDQVAGALQVVTTQKQAVKQLRERYKIVLLDEVQDTSASQTEMLTTLFRGGNVMGVGDPHQSIYGWRGASVESLEKFLPNFAGEAQSRGQLLTLATSFRNSQKVLQLANAIVAPLSASSKLEIPQLQPRDNAPHGEISAAGYETAAAEAAAVAVQIQQLRAAALAAKQQPPSIAIILRTRADMPDFASALAKLHIPHQIVGQGGLLTTPEITELLSLAKVVADLDASNELLRLLVGPRYQIGLHDLAQLPQIAKQLEQQDHLGQPLSELASAADKILAAPERTVTIVQALDTFTQRELHDPLYSNISHDGKQRLKAAAQMLRRLRGSNTSDVLELLHRMERELLLDIELAAHPQQLTPAGKHHYDPRSNIDRLLREIAGYLKIQPTASLKQVLVWLAAAREKDKLPAHTQAVNPETVQIITSHSSKGLEWDAVFVPRLQDKTMPNRLKDSYGWLSSGKLPASLSKDHAALPQLNLNNITNQDQFDKEILPAYREALQQRHQFDERRVAYVTFTRAKKWLYLSYSFWQENTKTPAKPSPYVTELMELQLLPSTLPLTAANPSPPEISDVETRLSWPRDPLGSRRPALRQAQKAVQEMQTQLLQQPETLAPLSQLQQLLLAEQRTAATNSNPVLQKINASAFAQAVQNPSAYRAQLTRPIPQKPYRAATLGTQFHEWVESHYATAATQPPQLAGLETPPRARLTSTVAQQEHSSAALQQLQHNFKQSKWYQKQPIAVETEILLPFAGTLMHCKIDAVFAWQQADGSTQIEIVDWKTGRQPQTPAERAEKFLQLQLYRHAYIQEHQLAPNQVTASLFYVAHNHTLQLSDLDDSEILSLAQLEQRYQQSLQEAAQ